MTDDRRPATLGEMIFIVSLLFGGFFLALLVTEAVNQALGPMPGWAYFFVGVAVVGLQFIVAIVWEKQTPGFAELRYPEIWPPRVMQRGYGRILGLGAPSNRRIWTFGIFVLVYFICGKQILSLWSKLGSAPATNFETGLRMVVSGFGTLIALYLIASLLAGLWPERHKAE